VNNQRFTSNKSKREWITRFNHLHIYSEISDIKQVADNLEIFYLKYPILFERTIDGYPLPNKDFETWFGEIEPAWRPNPDFKFIFGKYDLYCKRRGGHGYIY
jgi:hypothetical protein